MRLIMRMCLFGMLAASFPGASDLRAETVTVHVSSKEEGAVKDAVITATPRAGGSVSPEPVPAKIDQVDKEYVEHVTPVRVGTPVHFPNHDKIRHHVYSFSPAKTFEIPLYLGTPREPTLFDKPGAVSLGCNIHDWMTAYVYVVESPYFSQTGENGETALDLPPGKYYVRVWHPRLQGPVKETTQELTVEPGNNLSVSSTIRLKKVWKPRRSPVTRRGGGGGYR